MNSPTGHWSDFGMDTISLAGPLESKLSAIRNAGFAQVMLSAGDLAGHADGVAAGVRVVKASGVRVTAFQALSDFEGLTGPLHAYKVEVAKSLLEMCSAVGSPILVATSSTLPHSSDDRGAIAADLRKLAMLALPLGIKVAYTALSWGRAIVDFKGALDVVARADMPNLGIGIDSFQALATKSALDELEMVLAETILLVQLSDFMVAELSSNEDRISTAEHLRVFPGEGMHSAQLAELAQRLTALGYRGDYSFEVFNDDYHQMDPATVAGRARRSATWLGEEVLKRAVPLPWSARLKRRERA
jgi:sugar phosphate isomerase/epimerase